MSTIGTPLAVLPTILLTTRDAWTVTSPMSSAITAVLAKVTASDPIAALINVLVMIFAPPLLVMSLLGPTRTKNAHLRANRRGPPPRPAAPRARRAPRRG